MANENKINWDEIINSLSNGVEKSYNDITTEFKIENFLLDNLKWTEYNLDLHLIEVISNLSGVTVGNGKIIKINPGNCVPLHNLNSSYRNEINIFNYFITDPIWGQTIALKDSILYNVEKNTIHKWNNKDEYHFATNCGTKSFYILQCLG